MPSTNDTVVPDPDDSSGGARRPLGLVVGASRGLGLAITTELIARGWDMIATVRDPAARTPLHDLADEVGDRLVVEHLDIDEPDQLDPLHERLADRLAGQRLDLLLLNAGTSRHEQTPIGQVPTEDFVAVMVTNALSPARVIEALTDLVVPDGLIAAMSSGQGSITNNTSGLREVYRGSKAALNMFVRSVAARAADTARGYVLLAPGWIRTDLGGPEAPYTMEEAVPRVVDVLLSRRGVPGIAYLDQFGETVPW